MAKTGAGKTGKTDGADARFFATVMELAAHQGWRRLNLVDIAEAAGLSLAELHQRFGGKQAILAGFVDHIDETVLAAVDSPPDVSLSARDRLFDVLMRRFDALLPYRDGLKRIAREGGGGDLVDLLYGAQRLTRSMAWMLEAVGIATSGVIGSIRVKGLAAIYAATFNTWLRDDSEDMARTMQALDRHLARAERFASMQGPLPRRPQGPPPGPDMGPQPGPAA